MDQETREALANLTKIIEGGFASVAEGIADLRRDVDEIRHGIAGLDGRIATLETGMVSLKSEQLALESKVDGVNRRLDSDAIAAQDQQKPAHTATIGQLIDRMQQRAEG